METVTTPMICTPATVTVTSHNRRRVVSSGNGEDDHLGFCNDSDSQVSGSENDSGGDISGAPDTVPWLKDLRRQFVIGEAVEGGHLRVKFNTKATRECYPFSNKTSVCLFAFCHTFQLSRTAVKAMIDMLPAKDENGCFIFNPEHLLESAESFMARQRQYLDLLILIERKERVKEGCGKGRQQQATVYDIPINLILDHKLRSLSARQEMASNPGGRTVSAAEAGKNGLLSEHVTPGPVKASGDVLRTNMNGTLARRSPLMGFDGFRLRSHKRAYIGEIVMGSLSDGGGASPRQVPCRIISIYWDDDHESIRIGDRRFRTVEEVRSSLTDCNRTGLKRLWEEVGLGGEVDVDPGALLDFCEVLLPLQVRRGVHKEPWVHGARKFEGWTFVGEGFVHKVGGRVPRFETTSGERWS